MHFFCRFIWYFHFFVVPLHREMNEGTRKGSLARVNLCAYVR